MEEKEIKERVEIYEKENSKLNRNLKKGKKKSKSRNEKVNSRKRVKLSNFPPKPKTIGKKLEYIQTKSEKQKV